MADTREILMKYLYQIGRQWDNGGNMIIDNDQWVLDGDDLDNLINDLDNR